MKKNMWKMVLDIVMILVVAVLCNTRVTGTEFHETAGLAVFGLFVIHCLLNRKWIAAVSAKLFDKSLSAKVKIGYIVNCLLAVSFIFVIISGICISQDLFPSVAQNSPWRAIHHFSAAIALILVGIHLGLHWLYVMGMFRKIITVQKIAAKAISIILLIAILGFGVYSITSSSFAGWLTEPFVTQVKSDNHIETSDKFESANVNVTEDMDKTVETSLPIVLNTLGTYLSIIGLFAAITFYLEKLFLRKKKAKAQ